MSATWIARGCDMGEECVEDGPHTDWLAARAAFEAMALFDVQQLARIDDGVETIEDQHVFGRPSWNINQ